jgi:diguanylate cyclase (GGDEF)-like protein
MELAERIRKALAGRRIGPYSITVSIGVADLKSSQDRTLESLCDAADRALYQAKSRGRNCAAMLDGCSPELDDNEGANDSVPAASSG